MQANFNTHLKGIQTTLGGKQVSDVVRLRVFPDSGCPGNIVKMGTYCKNVAQRPIPK